MDNIIYIIVINLSPHIPYDLTNEISCHSILLMHYPWPMHGELGLVLSEAIDSVKNLLQNGMFPDYIKVTLEKYITTSDAEKDENEYISNQKDDENSDDFSDDYENNDNPFFME